MSAKTTIINDEMLGGTTGMTGGMGSIWLLVAVLPIVAFDRPDEV